MSNTALPTTKAVRDLLSTLFGRDVELSELPTVEPDLAPSSTVAVYRNAGNNDAAVVTADLTLSAHLAAMLGLTSKDAADEAVRRGTLSDAYAENLHEILSIMGALFNAEGSARVGLHAVHGPGEPVPPRVAAFAASIGSRLDLTLSLPGYGAGVMSIVV